MAKPLVMLLIGLFFGTGLGYVVAASAGTALPTHDHASHDHGSPAAHAHGAPLVLAADDAAPTVNIEVLPDPESGWNLHVATTNFRFAPESAGAANAPGEGHAHVYLDGIKLARIYGAWHHLATLPDNGELTVALTANDHSPLVVGSTPVAATRSLGGS